MDLKNLKLQITYQIERKPGGGFIARATDPAVPSLEAPTREELEEKIRAEAFAKAAAEFPALKGLLERQLKSAEQAGSKHSSSFVIRTVGDQTSVSEFATPEEKEEFAKEFGGLMNKSFPELVRAMAAQKGATTTLEIKSGASSPITKLDGSLTNIPIVPEASSRWPLIVVGLSILATLIYFLVLHR